MKAFKNLVPGNKVYYVRTYNGTNGPDLIESEVFNIDTIDGIFSIKLEDPVSWCPILDNKELDLNIAHAGQHITIYTSHELAKEGYLKECKDFLRANYKIIKSHEVKLMKLRDIQLKFQKIVDDYENI